MVDMINSIMKKTSTKNFVEQIEKKLPAMFECERCCVMLVHRWKRYLFRFAKKDGVDSIEEFDIGRGLSGKVAL